MATQDKPESSYPLHPGFPHLPPTVPSTGSDTALVASLLDDWLGDQSGYDEATWPELKASLDRDRLSSRKLFDG